MPPKKKSKIPSPTEGGDDSPLGRDEAPTHTPSPLAPTSNPGGIPALLREYASSSTPSVPIEGSNLPGKGTSTQVKPGNWANLQALMDALQQVAGITGLEPVKTVIEGLVELIGLYEDAAQGQTEFDDLRVQLECIFDELKHHISSSPVITTSMESICWSMQKEIEVVKARQARPKKRKFGDVNGDTHLVLECYRRLQDHLQRLSRNANIKAWQIVDQLATDNRLEKLAPSSWACFNSEKALELKRRSCTEGTRTNVLGQMYQWATGQNTGNIYWMSGMAGTGKTTIAYSLCEQLDGKTTRMLCASFFCSRSLPECRDVGRIIPSIAYQLAQFSRPFRYGLSQATEKDPLAHTRLPQMQFESLILQPLLNASVSGTVPRNMVVVIDALDECEDVKSTKQILNVLLTKSKDLPIKFVVSSRPEPAIRDQMEKSGTWVDARVVLHELDSGEVRTDIKTYLQAELAPANPSDSDIDKLAERAGLLFIYAATVVRYVGYDDFARSRARLKAVLDASEQQTKAQTEEIDQLYGTILEAAVGDTKLEPTEREDIKLILDTVICARAPLAVTALNQLLQLGAVDRVQAAIRPLWSVLHVTGPDMTVTILHASFPDYLLDRKRSGAWHCDAATHHQLLAQRCFDCIRNTKPQFNICHLESSYLLDREVVDLDARVRKFISSELRYSCQYWSNHLCTAESVTAPDLTTPLSQFLNTHLLLWMEVRNLTNTCPATLGELTAAKRWATQHHMTRDAIDLLSDAWRLASTFVSNPVSQSTPHLYLSMLPLLPPSSPMRGHYSGRFQGMIGVEGTALGRRKDELLAQWKFELDIRHAARSPDGTRIAIGGSPHYGKNDCIYLLDAYSGTLLLDLPDEAFIQFIAFSPDSTRLVSGKSNGFISVWDATTGQHLLGPFRAHSQPISSIWYSHNGSYIVSASKDGTIRIWDSLSGSPALPPLVGCHEVNCIAITSDDARLFSGSGDGTIRVWGMQSGEYIMDPIITHDHVVDRITLSLDESYVFSRCGTTIRVWNSQTGQMVLGPLEDHGNRVGSLSISPDGTTIASTSDIDGVRIWDAASGEVISQLGPFSDETYFSKGVIYSPDGTRIILSRSDGTVRLLDTQTATKASDPPSGHTRCITSIDISPSGRYVVSGSSDCTLCVWDVAQATLLVGPLQGHTKAVNMVRFSPDGSRIVSCSEESTIRQWDVHSGAVQGMPISVGFAGQRGVISAVYSQGGDRIVSLTHKGELSAWNSSNGQSVLWPIPSPGGSNGVHAEFSPCGSNVIAGYRDGSTSVWDVKNGQMLLGHRGHRTLDVSSFAFSPNGLYYTQPSTDGKIGLKSIQTGKQMPQAFEGQSQCINSVKFSSDGTRIVSGSEDNTVHVWGVETRQSLFGPLNGHTDGITSVAFSPDGKFVVSSSKDLAIRVWSAEPNISSGQDRGVEYADRVLNKDGWVVSGMARRLFWVPSDLHTSLMSPKNISLISQEGYVRLSFGDALIGEAWAGCFRGC